MVLIRQRDTVVVFICKLLSATEVYALTKGLTIKTVWKTPCKLVLKQKRTRRYVSDWLCRREKHTHTRLQKLGVYNLVF